MGHGFYRYSTEFSDQAPDSDGDTVNRELLPNVGPSCGVVLARDPVHGLWQYPQRGLVQFHIS